MHFYALITDIKLFIEIAATLNIFRNNNGSVNAHTKKLEFQCTQEFIHKQSICNKITLLQLETAHFCFVYIDFKPGAAYKKKEERKKKRKKVAHRVSSYFSISLELAKSFISQIYYLTVTDLDRVEKHVENTD